jgi:hypothetical protein
MLSKKFEKLLGCVIDFKTVAMKAQSQLTTALFSFEMDCPTLSQLPLLTLPAFVHQAKKEESWNFADSVSTQ